jgi:hypothetical protein
MDSERLRAAGLLTAGLLWAGCYSGADDGANGQDGSMTAGEDAGDDGADDGPTPEAPETGGVGIAGLRRLSRDEIDSTLRDLVGDQTRPATTNLPEDAIDPFDNDVHFQDPNTIVVEGAESLAIDVSTRLLANVAQRDAVVGCTPSGASDATCMESFVTTFGRRALRRPLTDAEIADISALGIQWGTDTGDFYQGVDVVLRTFFQHPNFLYRVEIGRPTLEEGTHKLDDFEVATRLSYFIWGSTPNDELLDTAEAGELDTPEDMVAAAQWMLADPRARDRVDRFHAMWLGYHSLPHSAELTTAMRTETRTLLEDVIFDDPRAYSEVFTSSGSFINDTLAVLYGLPSPGSSDFVWTDYGDSGRTGLLSHGSFLSVAAKFGDTSPTQRGLLIRTRLLCQPVPKPPPTVDVDNPPQSAVSDCKWDRYAAHRENGACAGCHEQMDPLGFGLEQFDHTGAFRSVEADNPECSITGEGSIDGTAFSGPSELSQHIVDNELLDACLVQQVYRFAMGHEADDEEARVLDDLQSNFAEQGRFDQLVLALVGDEAFGFRREG